VVCEAQKEKTELRREKVELKTEILKEKRVNQNEDRRDIFLMWEGREEKRKNTCVSRQSDGMGEWSNSFH